MIYCYVYEVMRLKKILPIILCMAILIISGINAFAYEVPQNIKVGLCYGSNARTTMELFSNEGFRIGFYDGTSLGPVWETDYSSLTVAVTSGTLYISYGYGSYDEANAVSGGGFVLYTNNSFYKAYSEPHDGFDAYLLSEGAMAVRASGSPILVVNKTELGAAGRNGLTMIDGYSYRGGAEMVYAGSGVMTVINVVNFNDYLCGVVPREMPASFEPEALKAQAVCARNYAMMNMGRYDSYGFDVTDDVNCQVYGGLSAENDRTTTAVRQTNSDLLMYGDEPVCTYFSSMSGGRTEACRDVWSADIPYLCGVDDPYEDTDNIQGGVWEVRLTPGEIQSALSAWGINIGTVTDMFVAENTAAGGVKKLTVVGTGGSHTFEKDECRNIFSLKSQLYTVTKPSNRTETKVWEHVPYSELGLPRRYGGLAAVNAYVFPTLHSVYADSVFTTYREKTIVSENPTGENVYILSGRGYGHRLGLSQWGAQGMAQAGFDYEQILLHYYPGSYLQRN